MEWLIGPDKPGPEWYHMCIRAIIVFFLALGFIHLAGMRTFGKKTAFDVLLSFLLGAILSRGITGNSPFLPTLAASFTLCVLHRFLAWITARNNALGDFFKGKKDLIVKDGQILEKEMLKCSLSREDILSSAREEIQTEDLSEIKKAYFERTGNISFVKK